MRVLQIKSDTSSLLKFVSPAKVRRGKKKKLLRQKKRFERHMEPPKMTLALRNDDGSMGLAFVENNLEVTRQVLRPAV